MHQPGWRNITAASGAIAPIPFIQPLERGFDPHPLGRPATLLRLRHGLLLHRIHPREPANRILLQSDRFASFGADPILFFQFRLTRQQRLLGLVLGHF